jgi:hypothetical protein
VAAQNVENSGIFWFPYGPEDVRECIIRTEKELRDIIDLVLSDRFGLGWETDPTAGFDPTRLQDLQQRQNTQAKRMHDHNKVGRLIDYTYIQHLKGLVRKHWEQVFCDIFPWSLHDVESMFGILLNYRDMFMHAHDENVPIYRKYLCLGICGEILKAISDWHLGFRQRGNVCSYECNLFFSVRKDDPDCESKAKGLVERWIDTIVRFTTRPKEKVSDDGRYEKWLIRLEEEKVRITIDKRLNVRSELITGEDLTDYCGIDVVLETEKVEALDKVIVNGHHPYWSIEMRVAGNFDMKKIKSNAEHLGKHLEESGGRSRGRESSISSLRFVIHKGYGVIHPVPDYYIEAHIQAGSQESDPGISLVYQGGSIKNGFFQAHKVLRPNTVLSILYDKIKGPDVGQLVSTALSLPRTT